MRRRRFRHPASLKQGDGSGTVRVSLPPPPPSQITGRTRDLQLREERQLLLMNRLEHRDVHIRRPSRGNKTGGEGREAEPASPCRAGVGVWAEPACDTADTEAVVSHTHARARKYLKFSSSPLLGLLPACPSGSNMWALSDSWCSLPSSWVTSQSAGRDAGPTSVVARRMWSQSWVSAAAARVRPAPSSIQQQRAAAATSSMTACPTGSRSSSTGVHGARTRSAASAASTT